MSASEDEKSRVSADDGGWNEVKEDDEDGWNEVEEEDEEEEISEASEAESIKEGMTGNLKEIFETKEVYKNNKPASIFTKNRAEQVNSSNLENDKMAKAEAIFQKFALFGEPAPVSRDIGIRGKPAEKIAADAKKIKPLNSTFVDKKERQRQRELDAGKAWGYMPKVELTDEIRNDLKAIQMRNQIFSKRFYKNNDSQKLPEYFQMGTWLEANQRGPSKKRAKPGSIAAQFLKDDEAQGFSKRKYEKVNDKRRRMGDKKT